MTTASTQSPNLSVTSLPGQTGIPGMSTSNLETIGAGAPSSLPVASGVGVDSPSVLHATQVAILTESDTTLTAYALPSTTGLAILDGTLLSFRGEGVTLSDGHVISLGFEGLVESTATATYQAVTGVSVPTTSASQSYSLPTGPGPVVFNSTSVPPALGSASSTSGLTAASQSSVTITTSVSGSAAETASGTPGGGSGGGGTQAAGSTSSTTDAAASLSARKAAALLGAVGGFVVLGL